MKNAIKREPCKLVCRWPSVSILCNKQTIITALLTLVATFAVVPSTFSDVIRGRVVDSETKEALPQATIKMTQKFGDNGYMTMTTTADSLGVFHIRA